MRFLVIQMIIVVLVCIFFAALANLTELGIAGWILAGSTGHALCRIYRHMHHNMKPSRERETELPNGISDSIDSKIVGDARVTGEVHISDFSRQIQSFMFDDATGIRDE